MWTKLSSLFVCIAIINSIQTKSYKQNAAVKLLQEYLQIDTSKEENIELAVDFWKRQAESVGLPYKIYIPTTQPIVVITWEGTDPTLPSIMLNSHMDVVPVDESVWKYPPFDAHIDEDGDIYARGAQDTKDVAIQYLEAIRTLKQNNVTLARTLHITLMPDEETGGNGMKHFVQSDEFRALNIGFALDEGLSSSNGDLFVTYQDRRPWQMIFHVHGEAGHGSSMPDDTAMEKTQNFINVVMKYRSEQKEIMTSNEPTDYGLYTSVNINGVEGYMATNIIPNEIKIVVDMRLSSSADIEDVENMVHSWMEIAGTGITLEYIQQENVSLATSVDDTNTYWTTLRDAALDMGIIIKPIVCPAKTDMLYIRNVGIPAFGFTPRSYTTNRIHAENEYTNVETFLNGIQVYRNILLKLGNL